MCISGDMWFNLTWMCCGGSEDRISNSWRETQKPFIRLCEIGWRETVIQANAGRCMLSNSWQPFNIAATPCWPPGHRTGSCNLVHPLFYPRGHPINVDEYRVIPSLKQVQKRQPVMHNEHLEIIADLYKKSVSHSFGASPLSDVGQPSYFLRAKR